MHMSSFHTSWEINRFSVNSNLAWPSLVDGFNFKLESLDEVQVQITTPPETIRNILLIFFRELQNSLPCDDYNPPE